MGTLRALAAAAVHVVLLSLVVRAMVRTIAPRGVAAHHKNVCSQLAHDSDSRFTHVLCNSFGSTHVKRTGREGRHHVISVFMARRTARPQAQGPGSGDAPSVRPVDCFHAPKHAPEADQPFASVGVRSKLLYRAPERTVGWRCQDANSPTVTGQPLKAPTCAATLQFRHGACPNPKP